jgi:hypothetical protein
MSLAPKGSPPATTGDTAGRLLRCLSRVFVVGEDEVHVVFHQLARRGRQCGHISLGEADANHKLLLLVVAQC